MFDPIIHMIEQDPEAFVILVLFIISEILGSMDRFKSSSVFQLLITVLRGMLAKTKFGAVIPTETHIVSTSETTTVSTVDKDNEPSLKDKDSNK